MRTLATRRPNLLRKLAGLALVLTILSLASSDASAQFRRGGFGGGYYGRGYGGFGGRGFYGRGYGYGYGPGLYNRGYGGFYNRGYYGGFGYPYARPFIAPPIYTGFGGYGGYGYGGGLGLGYGGAYPY